MPDIKQTIPDEETIIRRRPSRLYKLPTKYTNIINT
jgi:hypothetical protein